MADNKSTTEQVEKSEAKVAPPEDHSQHTKSLSKEEIDWVTREIRF